MDENDLETYLEDVFSRMIYRDHDDDLVIDVPMSEPKRVRTYSDASLLTNNKGIVISFEDGSEFQVQIVQSKYPKD